MLSPYAEHPGGCPWGLVSPMKEGIPGVCLWAVQLLGSPRGLSGRWELEQEAEGSANSRRVQGRAPSAEAWLPPRGLSLSGWHEGIVLAIPCRNVWSVPQRAAAPISPPCGSLGTLCWQEEVLQGVSGWPGRLREPCLSERPPASAGCPALQGPQLLVGPCHAPHAVTV